MAGFLRKQYDTHMNSWSSVEIPVLVIDRALPVLKLSDTSSQTVKAVEKKATYRMYVCGITPYDSTHLGHAATYLTFDLINRYLRASGSTVNYVQNITDIDDPLLERANRDGIDWKDLAHQQIDLFRGDMKALRVIPPAHYIGAVEAIPLVIDAVDLLQSQESVYLVDSDLYFAVNKDPQFGKRSHMSTKEMISIFSERGGDPLRLGKQNPLDCLVWMSQRAKEPGWESTFGIGRPGWHIECTAIALKYLAPNDAENTLIDIQGGGKDLVFPHHEMCAAQAQVMTGKELAALYVHAGMIGLDGEKMSKSKGNLVFVSRLIAAGVDPMVIRWALMSSHYRTDRMWSDEVLNRAQSEISSLKNALKLEHVAPTNQLIQQIVDAISNDLDTPMIIALLNDWSTKSIDGASGGDVAALNNTLDALLGLLL
jgi:L-cysteine:1D-myo-inositol 2-amino-2-deoxy-alpha-D-glucopyranoside ligase